MGDRFEGLPDIENDLSRLWGCLDEALALATEAQAPRRMDRIARLCNEAAEIAGRLAASQGARGSNPGGGRGDSDL